MAFHQRVIDSLNAPLHPSAVSERAQSGRKLSYIEGWHAIAEANRIFGFDAWDRTTVMCEMVSSQAREVGAAKNPGWAVTYIARVRVTVRADHDGDEVEVVREGTGAGHGIDKDLGLAHESAIKEAETDAMKRALMMFGNPFGLALYDKTQSNVSAVNVEALAAFEQALEDATDNDDIERAIARYGADIAELNSFNKAEYQRLSKKVVERKKQLTPPADGAA